MSKMSYSFQKTITECDNKLARKIVKLGKLLKKKNVADQIWRLKRSIKNWYQVKMSAKLAVIDNRMNILTERRDTNVKRKPLRKDRSIYEYSVRLDRKVWSKGIM